MELLKLNELKVFTKLVEEVSNHIEDSKELISSIESNIPYINNLFSKLDNYYDNLMLASSIERKLNDKDYTIYKLICDFNDYKVYESSLWHAQNKLVTRVEELRENLKSQLFYIDNMQRLIDDEYASTQKWVELKFPVIELNEEQEDAE